MIGKQRTKREQTCPVCLHAVKKYKKVESVTQNDSEIISKEWTDKKKTDLFKALLVNSNLNEKDFLENPPVTMIMTW